jgi:hypothetical protein
MPPIVRSAVPKTELTAAVRLSGVVSPALHAVAGSPWGRRRECASAHQALQAGHLYERNQRRSIHRQLAGRCEYRRNPGHDPFAHHSSGETARSLHLRPGSTPQLIARPTWLANPPGGARVCRDPLDWVVGTRAPLGVEHRGQIRATANEDERRVVVTTPTRPPHRHGSHVLARVHAAGHRRRSPPLHVREGDA